MPTPKIADHHRRLMPEKSAIRFSLCASFNTRKVTYQAVMRADAVLHDRRASQNRRTSTWRAKSQGHPMRHNSEPTHRLLKEHTKRCEVWRQVSLISHFTASSSQKRREFIQLFIAFFKESPVTLAFTSITQRTNSTGIARTFPTSDQRTGALIRSNIITIEVSHPECILLCRGHDVSRRDSASATRKLWSHSRNTCSANDSLVHLQRLTAGECGCLIVSSQHALTLGPKM